MKNIAIVGSGPTGIYTFFSLLKCGEPFRASIFEQAEQAGVGMPYSDDDNSHLMLANIASIEIPPLVCSYLDWLRKQDIAQLRRLGVDHDTLHERQFLPRILLGQYFREQFLALIRCAQTQGMAVTVHESCPVTDIEAVTEGVRVWARGEALDERFDLVVLATGHVWPTGDETPRHHFPSPWSGLLDERIPAGRVGIMGTSLSAIDAAMAVVAQHGVFVEQPDGGLRFQLASSANELQLTLMSRSGILPEADFYCPIPYEPLQVATAEAVTREITAGAAGLLDRVFSLIARELQQQDPVWSERISMEQLTADTFSAAYFKDRKQHNPFHWAQYNLAEVERNKARRHTVPWRYAILRLHEVVQEVVPHLTEQDQQRFRTGLCKVFVDNYAAIPPESIRRLLALRAAGVLEVLTLGESYRLEVQAEHTVVTVGGTEYCYEVFIDARGQRPLKTADLPFPRLRAQLLSTGEDLPCINDDYTLCAPEVARGRIALAALPYLMHDHPFVQGITESAAIGAAIATALGNGDRTPRRWQFFAEDEWTLAV